MDPISLGLLGLAALLALIALRMPVGYAMILVGGIGAALMTRMSVVLNQLKDLAWAQFSNYDLSVLPMFILMGALAARAGLSDDLFRAANAWIGRYRGGVAMAGVLACGGFSAVCGSSTATVSTMGKVALPQLKRYRYSGALATGTLAAGGTLGILIPPSVALIVYAIIVEVNVVAMFAAALIPGLMAMLSFLVVVAIYTRLVPGAGPEGARVPGPERRAATLAVLPVFGIFAVVMGGIYSGIYSPTASAGIGVALVLLYGALSRRLSVAGLKAALLETAQSSAMIFIILLGAELLKIFMARAGVPQALASGLQQSGLGPYVILGLIVLAFLFMGMLMDSLSMIILALPFLWPVVAGLDFGLDPTATKLWFGVIILVVVELGLITPPVGLNVFIANSMDPETPMSETFKGAFPFVLAELLRVSLLIALPILSLWLPGLML